MYQEASDDERIREYRQNPSTLLADLREANQRLLVINERLQEMRRAREAREDRDPGYR
jgi:hypothetical protein